MGLIQTRRDVISGIAVAATAGLVRAPRAAAEETLETTAVRLLKSRRAELIRGLLAPRADQLPAAMESGRWFGFRSSGLAGWDTPR